MNNKIKRKNLSESETLTREVLNCLEFRRTLASRYEGGGCQRQTEGALFHVFKEVPADGIRPDFGIYERKFALLRLPFVGNDIARLLLGDMQQKRFLRELLARLSAHAVQRHVQSMWMTFSSPMCR